MHFFCNYPAVSLYCSVLLSLQLLSTQSLDSQAHMNSNGHLTAGGHLSGLQVATREPQTSVATVAAADLQTVSVASNVFQSSVHSFAANVDMYLNGQSSGASSTNSTLLLRQCRNDNRSLYKRCNNIVSCKFRWISRTCDYI